MLWTLRVLRSRAIEQEQEPQDSHDSHGVLLVGGGMGRFRVPGLSPRVIPAQRVSRAWFESDEGVCYARSPETPRVFKERGR